MREATARAQARRSGIKRELTEAWARRRCGRRSPDFRRMKIARCVFERNKRSYQTGPRRNTNHVDPRRRGLEIGFLFRVFAGVDHMAKRAWMSAVKRPSNRLPQRRALGIIYDHGCPSHRLKRDPVQSDCAAKRDNRGDPASTAEHDHEASARGFLCQSPSTFETNMPLPSSR
jgi:ribosomal protein L37E